MNWERFLLWPGIISCNYKPPSSWPGNSLYHRSCSEDGVTHDALCTVKGAKAVLSGQLHDKTGTAQCLHCNLEIYDNQHGVFCWLPLKKAQSLALPHSAFTFFPHSGSGCSWKDWKYFYFADTTCKCMLWWPFGLRRCQMTVYCYTRGSEETHNCYVLPKKPKSSPKSPLQAQSVELQQGPSQGKSHPLFGATRAQPGLCLPDLIFTDLHSPCITLLSIMSLLCAFTLSPFPSLIPERFPPISLLNFDFNAIFCDASVPLLGHPTTANTETPDL